MNLRRLVLATLVLLSASAVPAADLPVTYLVDETALKQAVSGTNLTFELHNDALCAGVVHSAVLPIDNVVVSRLKRFKPSGGTRPPRTAEIRATLTGVTATGHLYLEVTGTGVMPLDDACQAQAPIGEIPATCSDGILNQDESDTDCGGSLCAGCPIGGSCGAASDCASFACSGGVCVATCTDGLMNQNETGIDCGGGTCPACAQGGGCAVDADCGQVPVQLLCVGGTCTSHCSDGLQNADETDIDCGGLECTQPCDPGQSCLANPDCLSDNCLGNVCQ